MLDSVKKEKKAEFVVDWNVDNYYAEYKDKDIKKDDLSSSMKEALLNDGTYISNLPVKGWKKSLLDKPKWNNVSNNTDINNNNIILPNQEIKILPGNHVKVTGFDIGNIIIRDRSNKGNKEDAFVSIKNEFKDEIINRDNVEKIFISPENLKDSNLNQSVKMSGTQFSVMMEYDNINIFPNIMFELDHIREMLAFITFDYRRNSFCIV